MSSELFSASSSVLTSIANALGLDIEVLSELGGDPVGGSDPTQAIDRAYAPDKNGISNMDRAADAVADADNMDAKGNKQEAFEDALEKPDNMRRTTVGVLKKEGLMQDGIIMSDGPGGDEFKAKKFIVGLPDDTPVRVGTFEYIDEKGVKRTETFYIFEQCANPAVDAADDKAVPVDNTCPTDFRDGTMRRDNGFIMVIDGKPVELIDVPVVIAPANMDEVQALAELDRQVKAGERPDLVGKSVVLLTDKDCDGKYEQMQCVTFGDDPSDGIEESKRVVVSPEGNSNRKRWVDYDTLDDSDKDAWHKRGAVIVSK